MKDSTRRVLNQLFMRYPRLEPCRDDVLAAFDLLLSTYRDGGKVLVCGNGGSAADAEHICGELLKSFRKRRDIPQALAKRLPPELASRLEGALPAVSLVSMTGFVSAFANDVAWDAAFAQQVLALADPRDALIVLSTSGSSRNCLAAAEVMAAKGGHTLALTGSSPSPLSRAADVAVRVPACETFAVQEFHLPVYHALCAALEEELFE